MLSSFPSAWLLLALPFASWTVIDCVPRLRNIVTTRYVVVWPIGALGLCLLCAGLIAHLYGLPLMILGGTVSGFAMFSRQRGDQDAPGDDWRWRPPPADPLPRPPEGTPVDWQVFDRLRAQWEREPARGR